MFQSSSTVCLFHPRGLQRDVVYLGWPIAPSYMSPNAGRGGELRGLSQWVRLYTGAKINFGDLTPYLKGQYHEIFCFILFHESSFPKPLKITRGSFWMFSKIWGDIRKSMCTKGINDTGGKFATGINDTGGKQWEQYQTADNLKWTWRKKFIYKLTLLLKGVWKK